MKSRLSEHFTNVTNVNVRKSGELVDQVFKGSLPQFVTAFLQDRKLSEKEIDELKDLLDRQKKK